MAKARSKQLGSAVEGEVVDGDDLRHAAGCGRAAGGGRGRRRPRARAAAARPRPSTRRRSGVAQRARRRRAPRRGLLASPTSTPSSPERAQELADVGRRCRCGRARGTSCRRGRGSPAGLGEQGAPSLSIVTSWKPRSVRSARSEVALKKRRWSVRGLKCSAKRPGSSASARSSVRRVVGRRGEQAAGRPQDAPDLVQRRRRGRRGARASRRARRRRTSRRRRAAAPRGRLSARRRRGARPPRRRRPRSRARRARAAPRRTRRPRTRVQDVLAPRDALHQPRAPDREPLGLGPLGHGIPDRGKKIGVAHPARERTTGSGLALQQPGRGVAMQDLTPSGARRLAAWFASSPCVPSIAPAGRRSGWRGWSSGRPRWQVDADHAAAARSRRAGARRGGEGRRSTGRGRGGSARGHDVVYLNGTVAGAVAAGAARDAGRAARARHGRARARASGARATSCSPTRRRSPTGCDGLDAHVVDCPVELDPPHVDAPWPTGDGPVVGFVGRIEPRKGALDLVAAAPAIRAAGARVVLVGDDPYGADPRLRSRGARARPTSSSPAGSTAPPGLMRHLDVLVAALAPGAVRHRARRGDGRRHAGRRDAASTGCPRSSTTASPARSSPPGDPDALAAAVLACPRAARRDGRRGRASARAAWTPTPTPTASRR